MTAADETEDQLQSPICVSPTAVESTGGSTFEEGEGGSQPEKGTLLELSPDEELAALERKVDASPSASRSMTASYPTRI